MASYASAKHAIEGYSESVDHEVREHGVRVLLVQPAYTKTGFNANAMQADMPLPVYAQQRRIFGDVLAEAMKDGDDPAIVAKVIVAAATDPGRSCGTHSRWPDASARCATSSHPRAFDGRSASSTSFAG